MSLQIGFDQFFVPGDARRVRAINEDGVHRVALVVSNVREGVPRELMGRSGGMEGVLNFAGGTSATDPREQELQFNFFQQMFGGDADMPLTLGNFGAMSGGTRVLEEGINTGNPTGLMTIVEVPALLNQLNPRIRTLGHAPRTGQLGYEGAHSSFSITEKPDAKVIANPDYHMLWLVQENASDTSGWNGDLGPYGEFMCLVRDAGMGDAGQVCWNGGGVTAEEIELSLTHQFQTLLIRGSGRITDDFINAYDNKWAKVTDRSREMLETMLAKPEVKKGLELVSVVDCTKPREGQRWLRKHNFAA